MLTEKQHQQLVGILSNETGKFDDTVSRFQDRFAKSEYFPICWAIQHLIQHDVLFSFIHPT